MDRETGVLIYANAGHEPPLLLNRDGGGETRVERTATTHGLPLGLVPDAKFETGSVTLRPSDNLVLFTDGITEAENAENRLFSSAALNDLLLRQSSNVPSDIISSVLEDVRAFTGEQPQSDDITLMVVRYDGVPTQKSADNKDSEESRESPKLRVVGNT
jgi:sigma-B regulation protein RsbU (phosphoserine phosphatase)